MDVEDGDYCQYDSVVVFDGPDENTSSRRFCGSMGPFDDSMSGYYRITT